MLQNARTTQCNSWTRLEYAGKFFCLLHSTAFERYFMCYSFLVCFTFSQIRTRDTWIQRANVTNVACHHPLQNYILFDPSYAYLCPFPPQAFPFSIRTVSSEAWYRNITEMIGGIRSHDLAITWHVLYRCATTY